MVLGGRGLTLPGYKYLGPFNDLDRGIPTNESDAFAEKHDHEYNDYIREGKNPYLKYNDADETLLQKTEGASDFGGKVANTYFRVKRAVAPRLSEGSVKRVKMENVKTEGGDVKMAGVPMGAAEKGNSSGGTGFTEGAGGAGVSLSHCSRDNRSVKRTFCRTRLFDCSIYDVSITGSVNEGPIGMASGNTLLGYEFSIIPNVDLFNYVTDTELNMMASPGLVGYKVLGVNIECFMSQCIVDTPLSVQSTTTISNPYYIVCEDDGMIFQNQNRTKSSGTAAYSPNATQSFGSGVPGYGRETLLQLKEWLSGSGYDVYPGTSSAPDIETYNSGNAHRDIMSCCDTSVKFPPSPWSWSWRNPQPVLIAMNKTFGNSSSRPINQGSEEFAKAITYKFDPKGFSDEDVANRTSQLVNFVPMLLCRPQNVSVGIQETIGAHVNLTCRYSVDMEFQYTSKGGMYSLGGNPYMYYGELSAANSIGLQLPVRYAHRPSDSGEIPQIDEEVDDVTSVRKRKKAG